MNGNRLELGGTDQYDILNSFQAGVGNDALYIGAKGRCRFCGTTDPTRFRKIAHTVPEALGNKWLVSRDECDDCNERASLYEDALVKAVSPFLTLGGTRGKDNRVRQTGRTGGGTFVRHDKGLSGRQLRFSAHGMQPEYLPRVDTASGAVNMIMPIAAVPFVPRFAYKALLKMAIAVLPEEDLVDFQPAIDSLAKPLAVFPDPPLEVVASFGSIGNAPPIIALCLLHRRAAQARLPSTVFVLCAGSLCLRLWLYSERRDAHVPRHSLASMNLPWRVVLGPPGVEPVVIEYLHQTSFDWTSEESAPQPVAAMKLVFDTKTQTGSFTPIFREPSDADLET